ncbi:MAG: helix-turn-helix domain-containing protein [Butyrivibrio sp.]|nr:helix-turn-helix domain-containing protein [Acetatifactor muris]MCM1561592.1 helix-turn-helix domain-containing protein [Butyrivibrio sp.]
MNIGKKMKLVRVEKGLNQIDMAREMETTQAYISQVETGRIIPNARFVKLFCLQYGVDKDSLTE